MTDLGELGVEHEPVDITFRHFGTPVRVNPDITDVLVLDVFAAIGSVSEGDPIAQAQALRGVAEVLVHEEDFETFWASVKKHRQSVDDVMGLGMKLIEAVTDRPTGLPTGSSSGQLTTGTRSGDASRSPAMRALDGRPDLQVVVLRAERERRERQAG